MTFNLDAFKQGWRALAARHGFDPLEGLTSYDQVRIRADRTPHPRPLDWACYEPVPVGGGLESRDDTENETWSRIEQTARRAHNMQTRRAKFSFHELYHETKGEWQAERTAELDTRLRGNLQALRRRRTFEPA